MDQELFDKIMAGFESAKPKRTVGGTIRDIGVTLGNAAIGAGESVVGLGNLATGGLVGKGMNAAGYDPQAARQYLSQYYSDAQQAANREVDEAEGFWGTAKAMARNPSTIAAAAIESAPSMFLGGGIGGKGLQLATRHLPKLAPKLAEKYLKKTATGGFVTEGGQYVLNRAGRRALGGVAGAVGEGAVAAGSLAEQIRQANPDKELTGKQALYALAGGAATGVLGRVGNKLAARLGVTDPDALIAGGLGAAARGFGLRQMLKNIPGSALTEGVFEELPQSVQEQIMQNLATGKPWDQDIGKAGAQGMLAGMAMGGGTGLYMSTPRQQQALRAAAEAEQHEIMQEAYGAGGADYAAAPGRAWDEMSRRERAAQAQRQAEAGVQALPPIPGNADEIDRRIEEERAARTARYEAERRGYQGTGEGMPVDEANSPMSAGETTPEMERAEAAAAARDAARVQQKAEAAAEAQRSTIEDMYTTLFNSYPAQAGPSPDLLGRQAQTTGRRTTPEVDDALRLYMLTRQDEAGREHAAMVDQLLQQQPTTPVEADLQARVGADLLAWARAYREQGGQSVLPAPDAETDRSTRQTMPSARDEQFSMFNRPDAAMPESYWDANDAAAARDAAQAQQRQAAARAAAQQAQTAQAEAEANAAFAQPPGQTVARNTLDRALETGSIAPGQGQRELPYTPAATWDDVQAAARNDALAKQAASGVVGKALSAANILPEDQQAGPLQLGWQPGGPQVAAAAQGGGIAQAALELMGLQQQQQQQQPAQAARQEQQPVPFPGYPQAPPMQQQQPAPAARAVNSPSIGQQAESQGNIGNAPAGNVRNETGVGRGTTAAQGYRGPTDEEFLDAMQSQGRAVNALGVTFVIRKLGGRRRRAQVFAVLPDGREVLVDGNTDTLSAPHVAQNASARMEAIHDPANYFERESDEARAARAEEKKGQQAPAAQAAQETQPAPADPEARDRAAFERKQERERDRMDELQSQTWGPEEVPPELAERLDNLERQLDQGEAGQRFFTEDENGDVLITGTKSTNPVWMRKPRAGEQADPNREILYKAGKGGIRAVLKKWRKGAKTEDFTARQWEIWSALQRAAWRYGASDASLDAAIAADPEGYREYEGQQYAERHGMRYEPQNVLGGNLNEGDRVLIRDRQGQPDIATVTVEPNGDRTLQDGIDRTYDFFDDIPVEAWEKGEATRQEEARQQADLERFRQEMAEDAAGDADSPSRSATAPSTGGPEVGRASAGWSREQFIKTLVETGEVVNAVGDTFRLVELKSRKGFYRVVGFRPGEDKAIPVTNRGMSREDAAQAAWTTSTEVERVVDPEGFEQRRQQQQRRDQVKARLQDRREARELRARDRRIAAEEAERKAEREARRRERGEQETEATRRRDEADDMMTLRGVDKITDGSGDISYTLAQEQDGSWIVRTSRRKHMENGFPNWGEIWGGKAPAAVLGRGQGWTRQQAIDAVLETADFEDHRREWRNREYSREAFEDRLRRMKTAPAHTTGRSIDHYSLRQDGDGFTVEHKWEDARGHHEETLGSYATMDEAVMAALAHVPRFATDRDVEVAAQERADRQSLESMRKVESAKAEQAAGLPTEDEAIAALRSRGRSITIGSRTYKLTGSKSKGTYSFNVTVTMPGGTSYELSRGGVTQAEAEQLALDEIRKTNPEFGQQSAQQSAGDASSPAASPRNDRQGARAAERDGVRPLGRDEIGEAPEGATARNEDWRYQKRADGWWFSKNGGQWQRVPGHGQNEIERLWEQQNPEEAARTRDPQYPYETAREQRSRLLNMFPENEREEASKWGLVRLREEAPAAERRKQDRREAMERMIEADIDRFMEELRSNLQAVSPGGTTYIVQALKSKPAGRYRVNAVTAAGYQSVKVNKGVPLDEAFARVRESAETEMSGRRLDADFWETMNARLDGKRQAASAAPTQTGEQSSNPERQAFIDRLRRTGPDRSRATGPDGTLYNIDHIGNWYSVYSNDRPAFGPGESAFPTHEEAVAALADLAFREGARQQEAPRRALTPGEKVILEKDITEKRKDRIVGKDGVTYKLVRQKGKPHEITAIEATGPDGATQTHTQSREDVQVSGPWDRLDAANVIAGLIDRNLERQAGRTTQADDGVRYSVADDAAPAGDRLVTLHNLTEQSLLFADKLGGLPVPSLGITKAATPYTGFGDISLIGTSGMVDPRQTPVFSADAYSQRFPKPVYAAVKSAKATAFWKKMREFFTLVDDEADLDSVVSRMTENPDRADALSTFMYSLGAKVAYLKSKGRNFEPVTKEVEETQPGSLSPEVQAVVQKIIRDGQSMPRQSDIPALTEALRAWANRVFSEADAKEWMDDVVDGNGLLRASTANNIFRYAKQDAGKIGKRQVDRIETRNRLEELVPRDDPDFRKFAEENVAALFGEPKIEVGGKKVAMTLGNVVKAMVSGNVRGQEKTMTFGPGQVYAGASRQFRDMDELRGARGNVIAPEEARAARTDLDNRMNEYAQELAGHYAYSDDWQAMDDAMRTLVEAAQNGGTKADIKAALRKLDFKNVPDYLVEDGVKLLGDIRSLMVSYYEAKPQRAVALSEFAGAVVPSDISPEARAALERAGLRIREYDRDEKGGREKATTELSAELNRERGDVLYQKRAATGKTREGEVKAAVALVRRLVPGLTVRNTTDLDGEIRKLRGIPQSASPTAPSAGGLEVGRAAAGAGVRYLRNSRGHVVGAYHAGSKTVLLTPDADAATVLHEIGWHAVYDWAKTNAPELYRQMQEYAKHAPKSVRDWVQERYGTFSPEGLLDEIGARMFTETGREEFEKAVQSRAGRSWYQRLADVFRQLWNRFTGANRADLGAYRGLSPEAAMGRLLQDIKAGRRLGESRSDSSAQADVRMSSVNVTQEEDAAYMDAVKRGDMETAQRMVDEAAERAGAMTDVWSDEIVKVYHGSPNKAFYNFDMARLGESTGSADTFLGAMFTKSEDIAKEYFAGPDGEVRSFYIIADKDIDTTSVSVEEYEGMLFGTWEEQEAEGYDYREYKDSGRAREKFEEFLRDEVGSDEVIRVEDPEFRPQNPEFNVGFFIVRNPNLIKSADPVTYDNDGNVIPLSKRFDTTRDDVRYSNTDASLAERARDYGRRVLATAAQWAKVVDKAWNTRSEKWRQHDPLKMGRTPDLLAQIGLPDLDLFMTTGVLDKISGRKHKLTKDQIKALYGELADPVAVLLNGKDRYVAVSTLQEDGSPVIIALLTDYQQGDKKYKRARVLVNRVTTAFGKDGFGALMWWSAVNGNVLYLDQKRLADLVDALPPEKAVLPFQGNITPHQSRGGIFQQTLQQAIRQGGRKVKYPTDVVKPDYTQDDDIRFSFAGEQGAAALDAAEEGTHRLDNLAVAREMEAAGKDAKAVKLATGWERGKDGKWRYEIDDSGDTVDLTAAENGPARLADVLDAPELFRAYPQLRDVKVELDKIVPDGEADYSDSNKTITLGYRGQTTALHRSVLHHELQHAVQHIEGFAQGGSPGREGVRISEENKRKNAENRELVGLLERDRKELLKSSGFKQYNDDLFQQQRNGEIDSGELVRKQDRWFEEHPDVRRKLDEIQEKAKSLRRRLETDPDTAYRHLAGETESRNVEHRLDMTPEQRRASLAAETEDVAREDQLVLNEMLGGAAASDAVIPSEARNLQQVAGDSSSPAAPQNDSRGSAQQSDEPRRDNGRPARKKGESLPDYNRRVAAWREEQREQEVISLFQEAYHGSPYQFSKFTLDHIGSGEGAQVHGWGLYFALNRGVGEDYADRLRRRAVILLNGRRAIQEYNPYRDWYWVWEDSGGKVDPGSPEGTALDYSIDDMGVTKSAAETLRSIDRDIEWYNKTNRANTGSYQALLAAREWLENNKLQVERDGRSQVYRVDIPEDHEMLREDASLDDQPEQVKKTLAKLVEQHADKIEDANLLLPILRGENVVPTTIDGSIVYAIFADAFGSRKAASKALNAAGIKGIRYKGGKDGECAVVFDDQAIEILETYYQAEKNGKNPLEALKRLYGRKRAEAGQAAARQAEQAEGVFPRRNQGESLRDYMERRRQWAEGRKDAIWRQVQEQLRNILPDRAQANAIIGIIEARAKSAGISAAEFVYRRGLEFRQGATPGEMLAQGERLQGSFGLSAYRDEGRAIISAFEAADISTLAHELAHMFRQDLERFGQKELLAAAEKWAGVQDGKWTRDQEEQFARAFERYLREGKAPTKELKGIFARFKEWLTNIYRSLKGSPINVRLTPEITRVFDALLTENAALDRGDALGMGTAENVGDLNQGKGHVGQSGRAGGNVTQRLTSEKTSLPQNDPALYKSKWFNQALRPGAENFDIGAGKTTKPTERLAALGVTNVPFDPFNREQGANAQAIQDIVDGKRYPTVTVANVLNVIAEPESRSNVILQAAKALAPDGKAFFDVYVAPKEGETKAGTYQTAMKPEQYIPEIERWFNTVERHGSILIASDPKTKALEANRAAWWDANPAQGGNTVLYQTAPNPANNNAVTGQSFIDRILDNAAPKWRDRWERFIYNFIDNNDPRERVWRQAGSPTDQDFVTIERLRGKKAAAEQKKFREEMVTPLLQTLGKGKLSVSDLEEYAHALHTAERNQRMREVNAKRTLDALAQQMPDAEKANLKAQMEFYSKNGRQAGWTQTDIQQAYLGLLDDVFNGIAAREQMQKAAERKLSPNSSQAEINRVAKGRERLEESKKIRDKWRRESVRFAGMTDAEAASIIQKWQKDSRNGALQKAHKQLSDITAATLDVLHDSGQLDDEEYQAMRDGYQYYVPLRRDGFLDTRPPLPMQVAKGSSRAVVNILANAVRIHEGVIARKHKADAARALYEFALAHPEAGITVEELEKKPTHDREGNIVMYTSQAEPEDGVFVRVRGRKQLLRFAADRHSLEGRTLARLLDSIKGSDAQMGGLTRMLHTVTRWMAMVNTSLSPEFMVTNFARDLQTAFVHLNQKNIDMPGLQRAVAHDIFPALRGIWAAEQGRKNGAMARWYADYQANGGKVGWLQGYEETESLAQNLQQELKLYQDGHHVLKARKTLMRLVEHGSAAIENCMRLATYKNLVERGVSRQQAARIASGLTVDFTQHGKMGPQINSLYMFWNASVQGTVRMVQAMASSKKVRAIAGGIAGAGFVLQMLALAGGGDDDSGEPYVLGIPDAIRERNIIVMLPGGEGKYIKIPKAYGYGALYDFGAELANSIYMGARGRKYSHSAGAMRVVNSFANSFNPIQSATLLQTLAPTLLDPVAYVAENKTWAGTPLMPEQNPYGPQKPDSERSWKGTSPVWKKMAQAINDMTGGDAYTSGWADVSPETFSMIWDNATGGMGRFIGNVVALPMTVASGDTEAHRVPFARQVYGEWNDRAISSRYYEAMDRAEIAHMRFKNAETLAERKRLYQEPDHKLYLETRESERIIRRLRKQQQLMEAAGNRDGAERVRERIVERQADVLRKMAA